MFPPDLSRLWTVLPGKFSHLFLRYRGERPGGANFRWGKRPRLTGAGGNVRLPDFRPLVAAASAAPATDSIGTDGRKMNDRVYYMTGFYVGRLALPPDAPHVVTIMLLLLATAKRRCSFFTSSCNVRTALSVS